MTKISSSPANTGISIPKDHPGVKVPPPVIVAVILAVAVWGNYKLSIGVVKYSFLIKALGVALCVLAASIILWCWRLYRKNCTSIIPHTPDGCLITSGPFSYSRNPIYLSFILGYLGLCLILGALLACLGAVLVYVALNVFVIRREEAYLIRRFGSQYMAYMNQTSRWVLK